MPLMSGASRLDRRGHAAKPKGQAPHARQPKVQLAGRTARATPAAPAPTPVFAATIETRDPELSARLLQLEIDTTAAAHRRVAARYRELGILDAAADHFQQASRLDPTDAAAYDGLARVWRDWGVPQLGIADANRAVYYAPESAAAHNTLGTLLTALGDWPSARREFHQAAALDPDAAYALNNLCYLSFLTGDPAAAAEECRAALAVDPLLADARNNLALAHLAAGKRDLAQAGFAADADTGVAFYNTGIAAMAAKDYRAAVDAFDAARRARPHWAAAWNRARQARRLLNTSAKQE